MGILECKYMTEYGKQTCELMKSYGLFKWYEPFVGHVIVDLKDVNNRILNLIALFLAENTDWVMGVEYSDAEEKTDGYIYVSPKEDL